MKEKREGNNSSLSILQKKVSLFTLMFIHTLSLPALGDSSLSPHEKVYNLLLHSKFSLNLRKANIILARYVNQVLLWLCHAQN